MPVGAGKSLDEITRGDRGIGGKRVETGKLRQLAQCPLAGNAQLGIEHLHQPGRRYAVEIRNLSRNPQGQDFRQVLVEDRIEIQHMIVASCVVEHADGRADDIVELEIELLGIHLRRNAVLAQHAIEVEAQIADRIVHMNALRDDPHRRARRQHVMRRGESGNVPITIESGAKLDAVLIACKGRNLVERDDRVGGLGAQHRVDDAA